MRRLVTLFLTRLAAATVALLLGATYGAALAQETESDGSERRPLIIAEQGNRPFGGTVVGEPDSSLHCDHGYVTWQIPFNARTVPLLMVHASSRKTWETTFNGQDGFIPLFLRRDFAVYTTDLPRTGQAGQGCAPTAYEPEGGNDQSSFTSWRLGIWLPGEGDPTPNFYPGVQFPVDDPDALDEFFRIQTPEFNLPENEQVETDALAVLLSEIGPAVMLTHSSTGIRGWITATKSDQIAAIVSYEPGAYVFPEGEEPPPLLDAEGNPVTGINPIPLSDFVKLTKMPIQVVWGDFIPKEFSPIPSLDRRRIRLRYSQLFANAINRHGGDAQVLILPEIGVFGNTHFPMLDLNNVEIANLLQHYLDLKGLTGRDPPHKGPRRGTPSAGVARGGSR
jgi:hypothetical protein